MASRSFSEEDLICPLCCDIFINPVLLSCNHSVCRNCIQMFWENQESKECPVCSRRSSKDYPPVHFALKKHCETFLEERRQKWSSGICSVHKGKLKLFCLDDQEPVCFMCRDLRKHTNHKFYPADEAMIENKEKLKAALKPLQEKLRTFESVKQSFSQTAEQIKIDAQRTERQIKAEFEELHQFLRNEEAARITTLREEEKQESHIMMEKIEETSKQISSLTRTIRDIEEQIKYEDISFLQNFKSMLHRAQCNLLVPDRSPVVTINFSNHLRNLKLTVLQKMQEKIGETTHFNTDHSNFHTAMEIFNNPVKHTKYKRFPRGRGNSTKLFRGKKSKKGPQQVPWEVHHATSKTPHPVHTMQLSYDRPKFPEQHPQYEITETTACNQTNHPTTSHKRHVKNRPGNIKDQNPDIQFPVVKDLVRKINEQMKM